jgi:hypothetical protein
MRRSRQLPSYDVNGWRVEKCPNSFAETYAWTATAIGADGYRTAQHGFYSKRAAVAFASAHTAPATRREVATVRVLTIMLASEY